MAGRGCVQRSDNGWGEFGGYMAVSYFFLLINFNINLFLITKKGKKT